MFIHFLYLCSYIFVVYIQMLTHMCFALNVAARMVYYKHENC